MTRQRGDASVDDTLSQSEIDRLVKQFRSAGGEVPSSGPSLSKAETAGPEPESTRQQLGEAATTASSLSPEEGDGGEPAGKPRHRREGSALLPRGASFPVYDFTRPQHAPQFTRDQLRILRKMSQEFSLEAGNLLSARLRMNVSLDLTNLQLIPFHDNFRSLPNPTVICTLRVQIGTSEENRNETVCLLQTSIDLAMVVFSLLCGGSAENQGAVREPTRLEQRVLQHLFFEPLTDALRTAWSRVVPVDVEFKGLETNPVYLSTGIEQDLVAVATYNGTFGSYSELIAIALPYAALRSFSQDMTRGEFGWSQASNPADRINLRQHLERASVRVEAFLGKTEVTVAELLALEPGDLVVLPVPVGQPIEVRVGGDPRFLGELGREGQRVAVRITEAGWLERESV